MYPAFDKKGMQAALAVQGGIGRFDHLSAGGRPTLQRLGV